MWEERVSGCVSQQALEAPAGIHVLCLPCPGCAWEQAGLAF